MNLDMLPKEDRINSAIYKKYINKHKPKMTLTGQKKFQDAIPGSSNYEFKGKRVKSI